MFGMIYLLIYIYIIQLVGVFFALLLDVFTTKKSLFISLIPFSWPYLGIKSFVRIWKNLD